MNADAIVGRHLEAVWVAHPRTSVHEAWIDARTPEIVSWFANLSFAAGPVVQVLPCEVEMPDAYPSLGIELREIDYEPWLMRRPVGDEFRAERVTELARFTPATVTEAKMWDALGEGVNSALDLTLSSGLTVTVRHVYPPLSLGIDLKAESDRAL